MKYFHYVSRSKVEMLAPQLRRPKWFFKIISKVTLGIISVGADIEKRDDDTALIKQLNEVLEGLEKKKLVREIHDGTALDDASYVHSNAIWRHGLFYFKGGLPEFWRSEQGQEEVRVITWTTFRDAIVLLVGSPNNILGDKSAPKGLFVLGTGGVAQTVQHLVASFETDELNSITSEFQQKAPEFSNIMIGSQQRYVSTAFVRELLPLLGGNTDWFSLSLAQFCLTYFSDLPQARLETVFRVFSRHKSKGKNFLLDLEKRSEESLRQVRKLADVPDFPDFPEYEKQEIDKWKKLREVSIKNGLGSFSKVFLGSPIYTALS